MKSYFKHSDDKKKSAVVADFQIRTMTCRWWQHQSIQAS